jgi:hypothetical protein
MPPAVMVAAPRLPDTPLRLAGKNQPLVPDRDVIIATEIFDPDG